MSARDDFFFVFGFVTRFSMLLPFCWGSSVGKMVDGLLLLKDDADLSGFGFFGGGITISGEDRLRRGGGWLPLSIKMGESSASL